MTTEKPEEKTISEMLPHIDPLCEQPNPDAFFKEEMKKFQELRYNIIAAKDIALKKRLDELGINMDCEEEKRRRFKRLICEYDNNEEKYWYDDGSETGLLILTIKKWKPTFDIEIINT